MRRIVSIALLFFAFTVKAQQKAMYSQYMFNGLALNPAYSATDGALTVTALTRHQWVGFAGAPNTQTISVHSSIRESNTSVGALLIRDQIGEVLTERGAYFTMAQRVEVGDGAYLAAGINGGIGFDNANYSEKYNESPNSVTDPVFQNAANRSAALVSVRFIFLKIITWASRRLIFITTMFLKTPLKRL